MVEVKVVWFKRGKDKNISLTLGKTELSLLQTFLLIFKTVSVIHSWMTVLNDSSCIDTLFYM